MALPPLYSSSPIFADCPYSDQLYPESKDQIYSKTKKSPKSQLRQHDYSSSASSDFLEDLSFSAIYPGSPKKPWKSRNRKKGMSLCRKTVPEAGNRDDADDDDDAEDLLSCSLSRMSMSSEIDDRYSDDVSDAAESFSSSSGYDSHLSESLSSASIPENRMGPKWGDSPLSNNRTGSCSGNSSLENTPKSEGDADRKDSFVYDVRMTDDQFLFFVPDLDLVKSHLMFAVREEVDVLKDRIVELMERVKQLECENNVLRQYASPEVLQQLQSQLPPSLPQNPHHSS